MLANLLLSRNKEFCNLFGGTNCQNVQQKKITKLPQTGGCHVFAMRFTAGRFEGKERAGGEGNQFGNN